MLDKTRNVLSEILMAVMLPPPGMQPIFGCRLHSQRFKVLPSPAAPDTMKNGFHLVKMKAAFDRRSKPLTTWNMRKSGAWKKTPHSLII